MSITRRTTAENVSQEMIASYQSQGFVHVPGVISPEEAAQCAEAARAAAERLTGENARAVFAQTVSVWRAAEPRTKRNRHPNVAAVAEKLTGRKLRLWHDQILIKKPHNNVATEFHQDQPYWPHSNAPDPISAWIALVDVPAEKGA